MAKGTNSIKIEQMAKILQKELARFFLREIADFFDHALITVTMVDLSADLTLAKVYVSLSVNKEQKILLAKINNYKNSIRKLLAKSVASKMYRVPHLKFILDESVAQGARVTALIQQLDTIES